LTDAGTASLAQCNGNGMDVNGDGYRDLICLTGTHSNAEDPYG
jgi:hypothetical protein